MNMEYWEGTVLCRRRGLCHITNEQCIESHEISVCGDCPHFMRILRRQEAEDLEEMKLDAEKVGDV